MNMRERFLEVSEICELYGFDLYGYKNYRKMLPEDAQIVQEFLNDKYDNHVDMI